MGPKLHFKITSHPNFISSAALTKRGSFAGLPNTRNIAQLERRPFCDFSRTICFKIFPCNTHLSVTNSTFMMFHETIALPNTSIRLIIRTGSIFSEISFYSVVCPGQFYEVAIWSIMTISNIVLDYRSRWDVYIRSS